MLIHTQKKRLKMSNKKNMEQVGHGLAAVIVVLLMVPGILVGSFTLKIILLFLGASLLYYFLKPFVKEDEDKRYKK
jgi:membrane protein implicated in regulation of membrane protease activity